MKKMRWISLLGFIFVLSCIACNSNQSHATYNSNPSKNASTKKEEKYTIEWKNYDGTSLEKDEVPYMETPSFDGSTPERAPDGRHFYVFNGWDKEIVPATKDTIYTACYDEKPDFYSIKVSCTNCSIGGRNNFTDYKNYGNAVTYQFDRISSQKYFYPKEVQYIVDGIEQKSGFKYNALTGVLSFTVKGNTEIKASSSELSLTSINLDVISPGTFSFECDNLDFVNWGDGTINRENSHTFGNVGNNVSVSIYGDIDNFKITSKNRDSLKFDIVLSCSNKTIPFLAYQYSGVKSIVIPNSVISIGADAFVGCSSLASISIPNSVTSIGVQAFDYCSSLTSIVIPNSVKSIGNNWLFYNCSSLSSLTMPSLFSKKLYELFGVSTSEKIPASLKSVILTDCTSIVSEAFSYCASLTSISISGNLISIPDQTFRGCKALSSLTLPSLFDKKLCEYFGTSSDSVPSSLKSVILTNCNSVCDDAFGNCSYITSISLPECATSIGNLAFYKCSKLSSLTLPSLFDKKLYEYFGTSSDSVPSSLKSVILTNCTSIGNSAFSGCSSLSSISIPDGVTSIEDYAFNYCSSLSSISIPDGVISIGKYAFNYCSSLSSISIPDGVISIGKYAFYNCSSLPSIKIPNSVVNIGEYAFGNCSSFTSISIPDGIESIDNYTFLGCSSLASVTISKSVSSIASNAFNGCTSLTSIKVDEKNTEYDSRDNCNAIIETSTNTLIRGCSSTIIPNTVTTIGSGAFYGCTSLTSIKIPESVTHIDHDAFYGCTSLTSIVIPSSVTIIDYYAFRGCTSLTSITISEGVMQICDHAFWNCSKLTSITIPESLTYFASNALSGCSSLASIKVNEKNTKYDSRDNCNAIIETSTNTLIRGCSSTIIPNTVTTIGDDFGLSAFSECSFTSITIPNSVTFIGKYAFYNCQSLSTVDLSSLDYVISGCENMFYNCNFSSKFIKVKDADMLSKYKEADCWSAYKDYMYYEQA